MSTATELCKKWEGRVVEGKFPLQQWLGGSDHSAVFLTERAGKESQKAVIKLIPAENLPQKNLDDAQLSRWADAAKLSHPHLIRLFECGRCEIEGTRLLYVVMEYAEENLAEILPLRPLSADEACEMLQPAAEALAYLHRSGFAHGAIKPSNILAVDNQLRMSADGIGKTGERGARAPSAYDAPEVATVEFSPAGDLWSLGATLVAVLTQKEPKLKDGNRELVAVPETIPQPLREIVRRALLVDPRQRGTAREILRQLQAPVPQTGARGNAKIVEAHTAKARPKRWAVLIVAAALFLIGWMVSKFIVQQPPVPAAESRPASRPPAEVPAIQSPTPFEEKTRSAPRGVVRGSVLQQVLPDISRSAQNTITGRVKVSVQVSVDASGNVSQAKLVSPGPSQYFASLALAAARRWKFNPPQVDGEATASEWVLRFQFGRTSTQVFPAEIKP
jgi:TonB family protein